MTDEAAVDANDTNYTKYKLAEMLDVGLKILQLNTSNELCITTMPIDETEKEKRESRIERRISKKDIKREERHRRHEEEKRSRLSGGEEKIIIRLSEETIDTSALSLQQFAIAQQLAAQQLAVEQLTAATAASAAATVAAAMAASAAGIPPGIDMNQPMKVNPRATDVSSIKVKLSLSDNIHDELNTFSVASKESMFSRIYRPESFMDWPLVGLVPPPPPPPTVFGLNVGGFQTVMLRNIPNKYTRTQLLKRFNLNFRGEFDFLYVPIDFNNKCNVGYAFVNFKRPESVPRFLEHFNGVKSSICLPDYNSSKICEVTPAHVQGLDQNIEHLRSSPISDQLRSKPEWQPLLFDAKGEPMPFPLNPNKQRAPSAKAKKTLSTLSEITTKVSKAEQSDKKNRALTSEIDSDEFTDAESVAQPPERESFPKKEKRRKEKNKRTANDLEDRKLEPCLIDFDIHTTAMVRYIPEELTRSTLSKRLNELFAKGSYDFLYVPIDFERNYNVGYFFIDFRDENALKKCVETFHNKPAGEVFPESSCDDYIEVSPARIQGLENNITNLKNSSVGAVGQSNLEWKPLLFGEDGSVEELDLAPSETRKPESKRKSKKPETDVEKQTSKKAIPDSASVMTRTTIGTSKTDKRQAWFTGNYTDYENFTSVMLRNLPNKYTRQMLQEQLDKMGFEDSYDFLYMPIDFKNKCNIGYAFINFRTNEGVKKCFKYFQGIECTQCLPGFNSNKIVEVTPARVQGLEANVRHLQNSAVIEQLQDKPEWKPLVLDEQNEFVGYPWKEITTSKLNAMANVFVPGTPSIEEEANQQWMLALDYMYRASLGLHWPDPMYAQQAEPVVDPDTHSTVMIRNIPNKFTRDKLFVRLKDQVPKRYIDFFYMPIDFTNKCNVGYCFVNFSSPEGVRRCVEKFHNVESRVCLPGFNSTKVCIVTAARVQGLQDNIAHLQNTSVFETLNNRGLDDWSPLLFDKYGKEIPFPGAEVRSPRDGDAPAPASEKATRASTKKGKKSKKKTSASRASATTQDFSKETSSQGKSLWSGSSENFLLYYGQVLPYVDPSRGDYTTAMIRNLPAEMTRSALIAELDRAGLKGEFDFIYLPKDIEKEQNIGYAFVNMRTKAAVETLVSQLNNQVLKEFSDSVPLEVKPARVQGREANIRYLSQMDDLGTEEWTPSIFDSNGKRLSLQARTSETSMRAEALEFLPETSAAVS